MARQKGFIADSPPRKSVNHFNWETEEVNFNIMSLKGIPISDEEWVSSIEPCEMKEDLKQYINTPELMRKYIEYFPDERHYIHSILARNGILSMFI